MNHKLIKRKVYSRKLQQYSTPMFLRYFKKYKLVTYFQYSNAIRNNCKNILRTRTRDKPNKLQNAKIRKAHNNAREDLFMKRQHQRWGNFIRSRNCPGIKTFFLFRFFSSSHPPKANNNNMYNMVKLYIFISRKTKNGIDYFYLLNLKNKYEKIQPLIELGNIELFK